MPFHSHRAQVYERVVAASKGALTGAAQIYRNAVTEALRNPPEGGYTTGAWDHGMAGVAGSVAVGEPAQEGDVIEIAVGTNVPYAKYWEMGHHNLFTRQFERVERWRPTLEATAPQMVERFQQLFRALVAG